MIGESYRAPKVASVLTAVALGASGCGGVHITIGGDSSPRPTASVAPNTAGGNTGQKLAPGTLASSPALGPISTSPIVEHVDNRLGATVFGNPEGAAFLGGAGSNVSYGVALDIACMTPNLTGVSSINALYEVADGAWRGGLVPANVMDNGGPMGPNSYDTDPRVPNCTPAQLAQVAVPV